MKKSMIFVLMLTVMSVYGQTKTDVIHCGVDFSHVRVVGADESKEAFIKAFTGINNLLRTEPEKYNIGKYVKYNIGSLDTEYVDGRLEKLNEINFLDKQPEEISITNVVNDFPKKEGTFLLIVAHELNKPKNRGLFSVVVFNGATKEILYQSGFSGKAGGFGLRNFWARALYAGMKELKRN